MQECEGVPNDAYVLLSRIYPSPAAPPIPAKGGEGDAGRDRAEAHVSEVEELGFPAGVRHVRDAAWSVRECGMEADSHGIRAVVRCAGEAGTMAAAMPLRTYRVELHQGPGSTAWWVSVAAPRGCFTQGETQAKALEGAQDAISGHLAALGEPRRPPPPPDAEWPAVTVVGRM